MIADTGESYFVRQLCGVPILLYNYDLTLPETIGIRANSRSWAFTGR